MDSACAVLLRGPPNLHDHHLERGGNGHCHEHSDEAAEEATDPAPDVRADEDGEEHDQWIDLNGAAHDNGIQEMVLHECVRQERRWR